MTKKTVTHTQIDALIAVTKRLMRYEDRYNRSSDEFYNQFLNLKRFLENKFGKKADLGFEDSLKPAVKDRIKDQIVYA